MDSMSGLNTSLPGQSAARQLNSADSPEQLLDAFKAAALSVTKLYKTSAAAQSKARQEGYQDCLDDLLAFLDKGNIGLDDGEGWKIRRWATERLDGRDSISQTVESEDEAEKPETVSSPDMTRSSSVTQLSAMRGESVTRPGSIPPSIPPLEEEPSQVPEIVVPSQEAFTFQSSHPYPQDAYLNLANLDLSDSRPHDSLASVGTNSPSNSVSTTRSSRPRHSNAVPRAGSRQGNHLGRGAGQKRKINFAEIFDLGSLGYDKNMFGGGGGKRGRHT